MSESASYKTIKKNLPRCNDRIDRIENVVISGMPDVNFCSNGVECWIELKSPVEPKRATTKLFGSNHKLSQDQKNWMLRQRNAGGNAWVLIDTDNRWLLVDGGHADFINEMTVLELITKSSWHEEKPIRRKEAWSELRLILQKANSKTNPIGTN